VDIEAAAGMLPSLKPEGDKPEAPAATGTEGREARPINDRLSHCFPTGGDVSGRYQSLPDVMTGRDV
jgi:hypothetical protein